MNYLERRHFNLGTKQDILNWDKHIFDIYEAYLLTKKEIEQKVTTWSDNIEKQAYNELSKVFVDAILKNHEANDKLSTWVIGGSAAISGLLIANIDKITKSFSIFDVRLMLTFVCCSMICGFTQKYISMLISFDSLSSEFSIEKSKPIRESFSEKSSIINTFSTEHKLSVNSEMNRERFISHLGKLFPFPVSVWFKRKVASQSESLEDRLKSRLHAYLRQLFWLVLQMVFMLVFVLYSLLSI